MALILKHQTSDQFVTRLRLAYRESAGQSLVRLATFVIARVQSGDLTDAQCRTAFGMSTGQWSSLKGRMQALINASATVESAVGE